MSTNSNKKTGSILTDIIKNRRLIWELAKNDFKTKFAGSYLGIVWAFIQPVITVFVYWFVFEKALSAGTQSTKAGIAAPYVLWLVAGIVPWFYFSDSVSGGTGALTSYDYLVKKVVFKIEILPIVKLISALFVHCFFVVFAIVLFLLYGFPLSISLIQILYYSAAAFILSAGIVYITSSLVVFFRDMAQIVNIILQIMIWATPIMWNIDAMKNLGGVLGFILRANPVYYISDGYRDSFINGVWFWEKPIETLTFWIITLILLFIGNHLFKRLRPHFADVL